MAVRGLAKSSFFLERVANRARRLAADRPASRLDSEVRFRNERSAFSARLAGPSADDAILHSLVNTAIAVTDAGAIGLGEVIDAAQPLARELMQTPTPPSLPTTHLAPERLATAPSIFQWGASDRVLDLLERYFEVPVAYHGVYLRRDIAVANEVSSNTWHLDMEDRKVMKVVVYLSDVSDGDGAFQYLPAADTTELKLALGTRYKVGGDPVMSRLVPPEKWEVVRGGVGSVLFSDTARVFHKGRRPERKDRVALFYDYTSRNPTHGFYCKSAMPRRYLEELTAPMGRRAHDAVFWRPNLTEFDPAKHEAG